MKQTIRLFAVIAIAFAIFSCSRYESVPGDPMNTKIYTLSNGLQVYMTVNPEAPRIQTYIAVKVGSKNDPSETTGLAHYFEHLMFKGTNHFGTSDYEAEKPMLDEIEALFEQYRQTADEASRTAIYHKIDSISYEASKLAIPNEYDKLMSMIGAGGTNAWTSSDETVYTEDIPSNQIDNWARIQADRFRNSVIRGFHTELETIYEEKNMSLTQDRRKVWEAISEALYPHHPYGKQTTLGRQDHLKNPSITNVKKYYETYYVPNNIRICLSGDFDPDEMVAAIEKYFGDWKPNPSIPALEFEPEQPITEPIVKNVYGLEAENIAIAWRLPAPKDRKIDITASMAALMLSNGQAGLIDIDINKAQKAQYAYAYSSPSADYGEFDIMASPKQGQTLEELQQILLAEVKKLAEGDFDENLIPATISNLKLRQTHWLQENGTRARMYIEAFINGIDWADYVKEIELCESITKQDIMDFAKEYLGGNSYAVVYKRQGEDKSIVKIAAPKITPIVANRDSQSSFLDEIAKTEIKPIEPVFIDFSKDMEKEKIADGSELLYKKNTMNDFFEISFVFNKGNNNDPALEDAFDYLSYLGTKDKSATEISSRMYSLACSYSFRVKENETIVTVEGLSQNMNEAVALVKELIAEAQADESVLANLKSDILKGRADVKKNQRSCFWALIEYMEYGPELIKARTLSNAAVQALNSEELLAKTKDLFSKGCEVVYYGPASKEEVIAATGIEGPREVLPENNSIKLPTPESKVVMAQYDANQIYYYQYSNRGEKYDIANSPEVNLYNEYFNGSMGSIVFQEMREARGLAYSASADMSAPDNSADSYTYSAFIATQNDKMRTAIEAFDEIINNMPQSEAAFDVAKGALIERLRTTRIVRADVLWTYLDCQKLGLAEPASRAVFEKVQDMTLQDVVTAQQKWVKGRTYTYGILGDIKNLDTKYLKTLGPVKIISQEEMFGF